MYSGAVFTMRLKDVLETTGGTSDSSTGISVLTGGNIGLDHYPIFTEGTAFDDYRPTLNGKIFDHFMNREIGYESIGIWQLAMRRKMNEIMPFYNQMYLSTKITINPLSTTNLQTENTMDAVGTGNQTTTSDNSSTTTGAARTVNSDTPQTMLSGSEDYASGAVDTNSQNENTAEGSQESVTGSTDTANGSSTITGYQGAPSDLIQRYRDSFINVDMMVINDLEELFMGIWDNGDSFTNKNNYERLI